MYQWLTNEIQSIKARRFHVFEPVAPSELDYRDGTLVLASPPTFRAFLQQFGRAALYQDAADVPKVAVYPLSAHRRVRLQSGRTFLEFGYFKAQSAYFCIEQLGSAAAGSVYNLSRRRLVVKGGRFEDHLWSADPRQTDEDFTRWLSTVCARARGEYSKAQWQRVLSGPRPFNEAELAVVEARRKFRWKVVDHTADGNLLFEVHNGSDRVLPFLSLGVRGKGGTKVEGGVWLGTAHIAPGTAAVVEQDCYRKQLAPNEVEVFDLPEPIPEKKERYWEFKALGSASDRAKTKE
jgi:hypothetical protein